MEKKNKVNATMFFYLSHEIGKEFLIGSVWQLLSFYAKNFQFKDDFDGFIIYLSEVFLFVQVNLNCKLSVEIAWLIENISA